MAARPHPLFAGLAMSFAAPPDLAAALGDCQSLETYARLDDTLARRTDADTPAIRATRYAIEAHAAVTVFVTFEYCRQTLGLDFPSRLASAPAALPHRRVARLDPELTNALELRDLLAWPDVLAAGDAVAAGPSAVAAGASPSMVCEALRRCATPNRVTDVLRAAFGADARLGMLDSLVRRAVAAQIGAITLGTVHANQARELARLAAAGEDTPDVRREVREAAAVLRATAIGVVVDSLRGDVEGAPSDDEWAQRLAVEALLQQSTLEG